MRAGLDNGRTGGALPPRHPEPALRSKPHLTCLRGGEEEIDWGSAVTPEVPGVALSLLPESQGRHPQQPCRRSPAPQHGMELIHAPVFGQPLVLNFTRSQE